jgi:sialic acid synthase SpsE
MSIKIGNLDTQKKCLIIAEAGVNHNGSIKIAEKLIKEAKKNGADIIKFQTYKAEKLVSKNAKRFWTWDGEVKKKGTQYDSYKRLDKFNFNEYKKLKKLCEKYNIEFMSTPFDLDSVNLLLKLNVNAFKIASCDITNFQLLKSLAKTKKTLLLSTGASNIKEIKSAYSYLKKNGAKNICIMHCTLCYPTLPSDANLSALVDIKNNFPNTVLGLSDHTLGTAIASSSLHYGVRVIEKHFTINKKLKKSADHKISLDPKDLKKLRLDVDEINSAIGFGKKIVLKCENLTRKFARRSIFLKNFKFKGQKLEYDDLIAKRPGDGISANLIDKVVNRKINKNLAVDHKLSFKDFNY